MTMMKPSLYDLIKKGTKIMQDNYPENLGKMMICNSPWAFTAVWAIVKNFVDERTREKINIIGGGYKEKLLELVDED